MSAEKAFTRLVGIMDDLREKCPWDRKQTIQSLRILTLEETYELTDAIDQENWKGIKEELGDLFLHLLFYSKIGAEESAFTLEDVLTGIAEKLIHRHPHVYGDVKVNNDEEVKRNWEKIKAQEGKQSALEGVPAALPALVKAQRLQEKAKQVGFEWDNLADVWEKVKEETAELAAAVAAQSPNAIQEEWGDLVFSLVNYARFLQIDPEAALSSTNRKFQNRFQAMEKLAQEKGQQLTDMDLGAMDALWNQVKHQEKP